MTDEPEDELPPPTSEAIAPERQKEFARRALLRAGWTVPLVTAVSVRAASAQSPAPHNDAHGDHVDAPHTDHVDAPHQDHLDHVDSHADSHADVHTDAPVPHSDVPHVDAALVEVNPSTRAATTAHLDAHGDSHGSA